MAEIQEAYFSEIFNRLVSAPVKKLKNLIKKKSRATWSCKDGRVIPISRLEDDHLINILKFLKRVAISDQFIKGLVHLNFPYPHGDTAQDAYDLELDNIALADWEEFTSPEFSILLEEAINRDLDISFL